MEEAQEKDVFDDVVGHLEDNVLQRETRMSKSVD